MQLSECCSPSPLGRLAGLKAGIVEVGSVHFRAFVPMVAASFDECPGQGFQISVYIPRQGGG